MEKVSPLLISLPTGVASGLVSLMSWIVVSSLVQVTLVPVFTTTFCGLNSKLMMSTGASPDSGTEPCAVDDGGFAPLSPLSSLPQPPRARTTTSATNNERNDVCITDPSGGSSQQCPQANSVFGDVPGPDDCLVRSAFQITAMGQPSAGGDLAGRGRIGRLHCPLGVVAGADQRARLDVDETEALGVGA